VTVDLAQTFQAHKVPILAAGAAGVAGLALYRSKTGGNAASGATSDASAGGQTAGMNGAGYYDSSASDVYGLVQPQLESLGNQIGDLADKLNKVPVTPAPVSKPAPHPVVKKPTPPTPAKKPVPKPKPKPKPAPPHAAPRPAPVPVPHPKSAVDSWVTVHKGDTLSGIAARYPQKNITWQSIYNANRKTIGSNPNLIRVGQRIHVTG
jgi:outer membrane biosynthesis protein TonB